MRKLSLLSLITLVSVLHTQAATIQVDASKPLHKVSPMLWGIFFEDINLSADGGIYAEMVRNRAFEDGDKPQYWSVVSSGVAKVEMALDESQPLNAESPHSLKLSITEPGSGRVGLVNEGYWGMALQKGETYELSLYARGDDLPLTVTLESKDGLVYAQDKIAKLTSEWKQYSVTLTAKDSDPQARLVIATSKPGTIWFDMISLFPKKTWKNRPNGLRPDLAEMLTGLRPAFVRFPGGCWVEGDTMATAYRWKTTIGDIAARRQVWNIWGYKATNGLGFHEYLQMCEDLGAEPLFVINCGMSHKEVVPMDKMDEFVQDALDAIEYANGPVDSKWGSVRAKAGHPAPFNMKYFEIGNENGGPAYHERWRLFYRAIKAKYPQMQLIANVWGGYPTDLMPEIVDEHYYSNPEFFIQQEAKYDKYDRTGPKIYVGEYAVTQDCGQGNLRGAIGEAAFMIGMERNSDVVTMASYAPLFVHVNHRRWNPDLINFDNSRAYGLPSYYVQKLFAEHRGDVVLPTNVDAPVTAREIRGGAIGVGTWLTQAEFKDIKVTQGDKVLFESDFSKGTAGWRLHGGNWKVKDGALQQTAGGENIRAFIGDKNWSNFTLTLKARKLGGAEGFLISFAVRNEGAKSWWNIGGWGNNRHAIEMGGIIGNEVPGKIETGRWYDIRVELNGSIIKCYLDGKLIHEATAPAVKSLYASGTRDDKTGEVILKVVNVSDAEQTASIKLDGVRKVTGSAKAIVLTSENSTDENSLDEPTKVAPVTKSIPDAGPSFEHKFPPNSLTVLRLPAK